MITVGEVRFVRDLLYDLASLADPSEYIEGEIEEAYTILDKLTEYNFEQTVDIYHQIQNLIEENKNHGNDF